MRKREETTIPKKRIKESISNNKKAPDSMNQELFL